MAGGGIRGGQAFGCTSDDGSEITDNPVTAQNLIATICAAVGLDHDATNMSNIGRPIPLADHGSEPVTALLS